MTEKPAWTGAKPDYKFCTTESELTRLREESARLREGLEAIANGSFENAWPLVRDGKWKAFAKALQDQAESALFKVRP